MVQTTSNFRQVTASDLTAFDSDCGSVRSLRERIERKELYRSQLRF